MKKLLAVATLLLPLAIAGCSHPQPAPYYPPPPPPPAYSQAAEQGHHDGIEAARRDISNGRPPIAIATLASATHLFLRR